MLKITRHNAFCKQWVCLLNRKSEITFLSGLNTFLLVFQMLLEYSIKINYNHILYEQTQINSQLETVT